MWVVRNFFLYLVVVWASQGFTSQPLPYGSVARLTGNLPTNIESETRLVLDDSDCFGLSNAVVGLLPTATLHDLCLRKLTFLLFDEF